ncbi:hypothetical protein OESDEN_16836, partial [Oesophagostomum dentatum]
TWSPSPLEDDLYDAFPNCTEFIPRNHTIPAGVVVKTVKKNMTYTCTLEFLALVYLRSPERYEEERKINKLNITVKEYNQTSYSVDMERFVKRAAENWTSELETISISAFGCSYRIIEEVTPFYNNHTVACVFGA